MKRNLFRPTPLVGRKEAAGRQARLLELRRQLESGSYIVDLERLAERLLSAAGPFAQAPANSPSGNTRFFV